MAHAHCLGQQLEKKIVVMQKVIEQKTPKKLIQIYSRRSFVAANKGCAAMKEQFLHFDHAFSKQTASQESA